MTAFRSLHILRRTAATLVIAAAVACHHAPPQSAVRPTGPRTADTTALRRDIDYLASPALQGRLTGTPGNDSAAAYIARRYTALRLDTLPLHDPAGTSPYLQPFTATSVAAAHAGLPAAMPTQNVVAMLAGSDPALRHEYVVIGAHFDHLGRSTFGAMDPGAGNAIRPGADDNASGTAAVMELARLFAQHPTRRSLLFVNFSGEELGLLGSEYFVDHPPVSLDHIVAMINFDMVGRMQNDKLIVYGVATASELPGIVDSANVAPPFDLAKLGDGYGPSDQSSFYGKDIPVLFLFTGEHADYHRATDVPSKIDVADEARVVDFSARIVRAIADRAGRLSFIRTAAPAPMALGGGHDVWFGSIPDMSATDVAGVRLSGVTPGSPADDAGVKAGDVIVEFGGTAVKDLYGYTDALYAHRPGDVVRLTVVRNGATVVLTATLGARGGR